MAADLQRILRWRDGRLEPAADAPARLLVADSFLAADGGIVSPERHRARFVSSVESPAVGALASTPPPADADAFWLTAAAAVPQRGAWFPRLELVEEEHGPVFRLRVRAAPPLTPTVTVATWPGADPRRVPSLKGPDLEALLAVRAATASRGAGEAVLLSGAGVVCDGTTCAIVWWEDETLCLPSDDLARVDSVTVRSLLELSRGAGTPMAHVARRPAELAGREVWALNALHGIRRIDEWVGGPALQARPGRLEEWRNRLETLRRPVPPD